MPVLKRFALGLAALACLSLSAVAARAADPRLPPGQDPGGPAIALIGTGIDYQSEKIAPRLARDGEGEMIAWDFVDNDRLPYAPRTAADPFAADASSAASALLAAYAHARLVPARIDEGDAMALARAIGFATGTPARIVAVAVPLATSDMRRVIREASARFKDHLFVVSADLSGVTPAAGKLPLPPTGSAAADSLLNLGNVLVVAAAPTVDGRRVKAVLDAVDLVVVPRGSTMFVNPPNAPPRNGSEAVALAAAAAACQGHGLTSGLLGSAAKAATLEASRPVESSRSVRLLDPMCWYGGKRM